MIFQMNCEECGTPIESYSVETKSFKIKGVCPQCKHITIDYDYPDAPVACEDEFITSSRPESNVVIPESFDLLGLSYTVELDEFKLNELNVCGLAKLREQRILLMPAVNSNGYTRAHREQTFYHELLHMLAVEASVDLDEVQVQTMGALLHQYMKTLRGDLE